MVPPVELKLRALAGPTPLAIATDATSPSRAKRTHERFSWVFPVRVRGHSQIVVGSDEGGSLSVARATGLTVHTVRRPEMCAPLYLMESPTPSECHEAPEIGSSSTIELGNAWRTYRLWSGSRQPSRLQHHGAQQN